MPSRVAPHESGPDPQPSETILGISLIAKPKIHVSTLSLSGVPSEIQLQIMVLLDRVSRVCLGLTSKLMYGNLLASYSEYMSGECRFPLAMQASVCGEYLLHMGWEDWFLRDSEDIEWTPSLGQLLWDERIWSGLYCCSECFKYKPKTAFGEFESERELLEQYRGRIARLEREEVEGYWDLCRRCRAKLLLIYLQGRETVYSRYEWEGQEPLGLNRLDEGNGIVIRRNQKDWPAYESWEEVFSKLDI